MAFFNRDRVAAEARGNVAAGPTTSFVDVMRAEYEAGRLLDTSIGDENALYDVYDEELDRLRQSNPEAARQLFWNPVTGQLPARLLNEPSERGMERNVESHVQLFNEEAQRLGVEFPPLDEMRQRAARLAAMRRSEAEDVAARSSGEASGLASFVGRTGAILSDPPVFSTMMFGAGASAGVIRTALVEAAIAGGTEIAIQPLLAESRERLGQELTFDEAVNNVLLATAGGGIFGGGLRAFGKGVGAIAERLQRTPVAQTTEFIDAVTYLERAETLSGLSPYTMRSIEAQGSYMERLDEAMIAGREGRAARIEPAGVPVRAELLETVPVRIASDTPIAGRAGDLGSAMREMMIETAQAENRIAQVRENLDLAIQDAEPNVRGIEELAEFLRNPNRMPKVTRLASFLKGLGGVRDLGGALTDGVGIRATDRPGLINNRSGMTLRDAAERAIEAGFIEDPRGRVGGDEVADLLSALGRDMRGKAVTRPVEAESAELARLIRDLGSALDSADLDIKEIEPGGVQAALTTRATELADSSRSGADISIGRSEIDFQRLGDATEEIDSAVEAEVTRAINDNEAFEFEMEDGQTMTGREMLEEIAEDQQALEEISQCVLSNVGRAA